MDRLMNGFKGSKGQEDQIDLVPQARLTYWQYKNISRNEYQAYVIDNSVGLWEDILETISPTCWEVEKADMSLMLNTFLTPFQPLPYNPLESV